MSKWRSDEEIQAKLNEIAEQLKMSTTYVDPQGTILINGGAHNLKRIPSISYVP